MVCTPTHSPWVVHPPLALLATDLRIPKSRKDPSRIYPWNFCDLCLRVDISSSQTLETHWRYESKSLIRKCFGSKEIWIVVSSRHNFSLILNLQNMEKSLVSRKELKRYTLKNFYENWNPSMRWRSFSLLNLKFWAKFSPFMS